MMREQKSFVATFGLLIAMAGPAFGHAAEQGFVLLLPTTAYITGGTIVVAATILLLFSLSSDQLKRLLTPFDTQITYGRSDPPEFVRIGASLCLVTLIYIGMMGPTDPQANLLPLVLWTVWWMAIFVIQGFFFDVWKWINPWLGLFQLVLPDHKPVFKLPERLSIWPATLIFLAFQTFVLTDSAPNDPDRLAAFTLGYWAFTFAGMALFGQDPWLRHFECFTVLFRLVGLMRAAAGTRSLKIGLPGWQIVQSTQFDLSHAVFVLIILAAGSFDGLHETFWWLAQLGINPLEYPGRTALIYKTSAGLMAAIIGLIAIFAASVWIGLAAVSGPGRAAKIGFCDAFVRFSITLLPIAIGYHFAHYFVTFLVQIQIVVASLADPLARGWNLFGLGAIRLKVGFLTVPQTVKVIWLTQAGVVVISHVLAVFLSHRTAEQLCNNRADILKIQLGLSLLMVAYTIFGLWLLASPRGA